MERPRLDLPSSDSDDNATEDGRARGRRLARARRADAGSQWREGFDIDLLGGTIGRRALRSPGAKTEVHKLPDVVGVAHPGVVVAVSRRTCLVELDGPSVDEPGPVKTCSYSPRLRATRESLVAVGDRVEVHAAPGSGWIITAVALRRTRLARPGPDARDHLDLVLAANLDLLVVVASAIRPAFHPRLVDRFLVVAALGGLETMLFLNKCDLLPHGIRPDLSMWNDLGVPVVMGSVHSGEGIDRLRTLLSGRWSALAGVSGVGKTSLLNILVPDQFQAVGEVRNRDGRGRHTTTRAEVFRLPGGGRLIDTPGIRELSLHRLTAAELPWYFPDFTAHARRCRFRDCLHDSEPECEVREGVSRGDLHPARHASYLRILEDLR